MKNNLIFVRINMRVSFFIHNEKIINYYFDSKTGKKVTEVRSLNFTR